MSSLVFATGNAEKFLIAQHACEKYGITVAQATIDIDEIQSEIPEQVARHKAQSAYAATGQPVIVSDDSWAIPGLGGFPGAYMHSINSWFSAEDFLRLVKPLTDRRVIVTQYLVYDDGQQQKVFQAEIVCTLLDHAQGSSTSPSQTIMTMPGDNGLSIAEAYDKAHDKSDRQAAKIWANFAMWYSQL